MTRNKIGKFFQAGAQRVFTMVYWSSNDLFIDEGPWTSELFGQDNPEEYTITMLRIRTLLWKMALVQGRTPGHNMCTYRW
eukprot:8467927-Prorocentrum_lima.AAC.1